MAVIADGIYYFLLFTRVSKFVKVWLKGKNKMQTYVGEVRIYIFFILKCSTICNDVRGHKFYYKFNILCCYKEMENLFILHRRLLV
jgi:hypothetical protein